MFFIFNKKSNKLDIKNRDGGVIFYAKKIERNKKEKWRRRLLVELEAEEYAKIDFKYFKKNQRIFYKAKHFFLWATRLLTPDFLIGHPNLFDNLKILFRDSEFRPLRMAMAGWLIFSLLAGSAGFYAFFSAPKVMASENWYNTSWQYRRALTIDHTKVGNGTENQINFPVLVSLSGLSNINVNGTDVRFTSSDGTTELPREIERYSSGELVAWVKVPNVSYTEDTVIYIYYGNSLATEPSASSTYGSQNVWDSNFKAVYHFKETGTNPTVYDSTSNGINSSSQTWTPGSGKIDGGASLNGSSQYITLPTATALNITGNLTIEAYVKTSSYTGNAHIVGGYNPSSPNNGYAISVTDTSGYQGKLAYWNGSAWRYGSTVVSDGNWHDVAVTLNGTTLQFYLDGSPDGASQAGAAPNSYLGSRYLGNISNRGYVNGIIDEIRISNMARSAGWRKTSYNNQNSPTTFLAVGNEENCFPLTPINSSPVNSAVNQFTEVTLSASDFSSPVGLTHFASQWQITTTPGNYGTAVFDAVTTSPDLTSKSVSLTPGTIYYWHVRYQDSNGYWSNYSSETSFKTSYLPTVPINSSPTNGALKQNLTPILSASDFSDADSGSSQSASQWQVRLVTDPTYSLPIYDSGTDTVNLNSISIPEGVLSDNTTYMWRVRYRDDVSMWSEYSTETVFSTGVVPSVILSVGATEYASGDMAKLTVQVQNADTSPINNATCKINIYGPSNNKLVSEGEMTYLADSNGLYYYNYQTPSTDGVYIYDVTAVYAGHTVYTSHTFHVSGALNTIATINTNLNTASTNINSIGAKVDTIDGSVADINTNLNTANNKLDSISSTLTAANYQTKAGILNNQSVLQVGKTIKIEYSAHSGLSGDGIPHIYVYDPDNNACMNGANMTEMDSSGIYHYNLTINESGPYGCYGTGYFTIVVSESTYNTHGNMTLYVAENDIESIGSNVSSIKTTVESSKNNIDALIGAFVVTQSSVSDTTPTSTSFSTSLTNSINDFYKNSVLTFTSGNLNGQVRRISGYNATTKEITLDPSLSIPPSDGDVFTIVKQNVYVEEQASDIQSDIDLVKSDVSYIKDKVDVINSTLQTVDSNLSSLQAVVNTIRTSQQSPYGAKLSDIHQVESGGEYRAKLSLVNYESNPVDAASNPIITIYDSSRSIIVNGANMTKISTGIYEYVYGLSDSASSGIWEAVVTTAAGLSQNQQLNDYFNVSGSPAQVLINSVSGSIPDISADVKITNEGAGDYEYHYEWCVVSNQSEKCGLASNVYYATASKLIQMGQDFITDLSATVSSPGTYWFKLVVYYGTQSSGASRQFNLSGGGSSSSGVSAGGMPLVVNQENLDINGLETQVGDLQKTIKDQTNLISRVLEVLGILKPGIQELLSVGGTQTDNVKDLQNKLADLQAISSSVKKIVENNNASPVVQTYMKFNSVVISFLIVNPAQIEQTVNFKSLLPTEVKFSDILKHDGLNIDYDTNSNAYFVYGSVVLGPKESITKSVEINDIWVFSQEDLDSVKNQANTFLVALKDTQYYSQGILLQADIEKTISKIEESQKQSYISPQDHILAYRSNKSLIEEVDKDLDQLKSLVVQSGASQGLLGKIGGIQTFATWGIILAVVFSFALMCAIVFSMWRYQVVLASQVINSNKRVLSGMKPKARRKIYAK